MTSPFLDVVVCLLLVSAAATTVATVSEAPAIVGSPTRADAVADTLATTTATVNYSIAPGREIGGNPAPFERTTHGTLATLLARATFRDVRAHGEPLATTAVDFRVQVVATVLAALPARTQVRVQWFPFPGSHLERRLVVGPAPPVGVDVHTATIRVPTGVDWTLSTARRAAATGGFDGLADLLAGRLVAALYPLDRGRHALADDAPLPELIQLRYRRAASHYGVVLPGEPAPKTLPDANARLAEGLSEQLERDLRARFDSPGEAADRTDPDTVVLVVRTWSA